MHVRDYDLQAEDDRIVFERAANEERVLVSADTDFGAHLASRRSEKPSFVLFRGRMSRRPEFLAHLVLSNFLSLERYLSRGAIVVFEPSRTRVRELPIAKSSTRGWVQRGGKLPPLWESGVTLAQLLFAHQVARPMKAKSAVR